MSEFKVGAFVECVRAERGVPLTRGKIYEIIAPKYDVDIPCIWVTTDNDTANWFSRDRFVAISKELPKLLTPEEVLGYLQRNDYQQLQYKVGTGPWRFLDKNGQHTPVLRLWELDWRIKPQPEVITVNGKRYQEIIED